MRMNEICWSATQDVENWNIKDSNLVPHVGNEKAIYRRRKIQQVETTQNPSRHKRAEKSEKTKEIKNQQRNDKTVSESKSEKKNFFRNNNAENFFGTAGDTPSNLFFDDELLLNEVRSEVEKIIRQEQELESLANGKSSAKDKGFEVELKAKNDTIERFAKEITRLREELISVKQKNKKMAEIFKSGEMKEKAEILIENEKLTQMNEELREEVSRLYTALEQEKSKVHEMQDKLKRLSYNHKRSEDSFSKQ
ncbi:G kinase-anchoring protein 1-like protein [Dinothrombium tinctorium]|uniref:G kinase-anchoring protein 1-like protein n=1 Tax=Dinothrombium tinctorium TaxID=1965070 RepID=A0A3S3PI10_9ACAR|nr:G kinase-anchoring protein 1-like protein [Dinothrombium tinctorium]RWS10016.1 G kinase-anchoring protein 1-like protein [Dinothrombium tinctorium]RWS10025.1 G kinase-anchoring protein 1-like protein [Dinothrombium tinctorium]